MFPRRRTSVVVGLFLLAVASAAWAQRFRVMEGPGMPLRMPPPHFSDGAFTICKMMFTSNRREANGFGWSTDYPYAGLNLMIRSSELTKTRISKDPRGDANYWTVRLTDEYIAASDPPANAPVQKARPRARPFKRNSNATPRRISARSISTTGR